MITRQVQYLLKAEIGYNTDNIVQVKLHAEGVPLENIFSFKQELKKSPLVEEVAYSSNVPGEAFGKDYKDFIRISFASPFQDLKEAILRLKKFKQKHSF